MARNSAAPCVRLFTYACTEPRVMQATIKKSMQLAIGELGLEQLFVVVPGGRSVEVAPRIRALPLRSVQQELAGL